MVWLAAAQRRPWARLDKWREVAVGHAEENGLLLHLLEREHRRVKNGTSEEGRLLLRHPHRRRPSHGDAKEEDGQGVQSRVLLAQLGQAVEALVGSYGWTDHLFFLRFSGLCEAALYLDPIL